MHADRRRRHGPSLSDDGELLCCSAADGKQVWHKSYKEDFGNPKKPGWGFSESPLVDGDRLIVTPGGDKAVLAALDKKTGKPIWATTAEGGGNGAGYASVVISNGGGVKQ